MFTFTRSSKQHAGNTSLSLNSIVLKTKNMKQKAGFFTTARNHDKHQRNLTSSAWGLYMWAIRARPRNQLYQPPSPPVRVKVIKNASTLRSLGRKTSQPPSNGLCRSRDLATVTLEAAAAVSVVVVESIWFRRQRRCYRCWAINAVLFTENLS